MKVLWLYDIDGTLLTTEGAGRASLGQAFELEFGVRDAFEGLSFAGATDLGITGRAFAAAGQEPAQERLKSAYLPLLERRLKSQPPVLYPGVHRMLDESAKLGHNALLTGNWRQGAELKLRAVSLWDRFGVGAFGDDSADRNALVPVARRRAEQAGLSVDAVVVIGDTPLDVACARAGGAIAVAVCTGWSTREQLAASQPDLLIEDLEQGRRALLELVYSAVTAGQ